MTGPRLLLDASALVDLFVPVDPLRKVSAYVERHSPRLVVSDFAAGEFSSAVARLRRMAAVDDEAAKQLYSAFDAWRERTADPAALEAADIRRADRYVRMSSINLRLPDAIHIATAQRLDATLATLDAKQAEAASLLGIDVLDFDTRPQRSVIGNLP